MSATRTGPGPANGRPGPANRRRSRRAWDRLLDRASWRIYLSDREPDWVPDDDDDHDDDR